MAGNAVYVVDDDAAARRGLVQLLDALGYAAQPCASGEEFLAALRDEAPCCVLIDAALSGMSGLDVLADLRNRRMDIAVVFMSAHPDFAVCVRAMKGGVVDFLRKPLRKDDLVSAIASAHLLSLNRQHARSEFRRARELLDRLTLREREVLALVLEGRRNKEIAAALASQEATVKVHRSRLMRKLGVRSVPDLVRIGYSANLALSTRATRPARGVAGTDRRDVAELPQPSEPNAWLDANGTWSGFTWRPARSRFEGPLA
jgi:FixJ family two-component response regulator